MKAIKYPGRPMLSLGSRLVRAVMMVAVVAPLTYAQSFQSLNPLGSGPEGFRLYSLSTSVAYYSNATDAGQGISGRGINLGADLATSGAATFGWNHGRGRSRLSMVYTSTYTNRLRYSEWNALNHALLLSFSRKLSPRWSWQISLNTALSSTEQFLFTPSQLASITSAPSTFEELAGAMLTGQTDNNQLSALLATPGLDSPVRVLLYGNRIFNAGLQTVLSYAPSSRTRLHFSVGATRFQYLTDPTNGRAFQQGVYLVPQSVEGYANVGVSRSLSPHTQISLDVSTDRNFSRFADAYRNSVSGTLGRIVGRHWFFQVQGGGGFVMGVRSVSRTLGGPQYLVGLRATYKAGAHTFSVSGDRNFADSYSVGAGSMLNLNASWNWARPSSKWRLYSGFGYQQLQNTNFGNLESWKATTGFGRSINRHLGMQVEYACLTYTGVTSPGSFRISPNTSISAARVSMVWSPQISHR